MDSEKRKFGSDSEMDRERLPLLAGTSVKNNIT
jgi:hypothetical protein